MSVAAFARIGVRRQARIHGLLSCFDRMLLRGYLPTMGGWAMAQLFNSQNLRYRVLKSFLQTWFPLQIQVYVKGPAHLGH